MKRNAIADMDEVLETWTLIMRGEVPDMTCKISDITAAAEKLYKHLSQRAHESDRARTGVIIMPEVNGQEEAAQ